MATAIFYASSTGNTEFVAKKIAKECNITDVFDIANKGVSIMQEYETVLIGISTWGEGELQDDWDDVWSEFCDIDFSGKTVAIFGFGDQDSYADTFVDAMGIVYEQVVQKGARVIGEWSAVDYDYEESKAEVVEGYFVGLVLDEENQSELTDERIKIWCKTIKNEII
ncbi:MAG: flavodoxin [Candidatus Marinarcus sp.]|uniref:flavodoxin n=1 Tax=Candidatus Marinarcus sp. TaxID=3100987 RepID=UPI003B00615F